MSSTQIETLRWRFRLTWKLAGQHHLAALTDAACLWEPAPGAWTVRQSRGWRNGRVQRRVCLFTAPLRRRRSSLTRRTMVMSETARRGRKATAKPATKTYEASAYAAASARSPLAPATILRRGTTARDVRIEILFCGICHSDLHTVRDEWSGFMPTTYPCVPGHEIIGRVTEVRPAVTRFKPGAVLGDGCLVHSDSK